MGKVVKGIFKGLALAVVGFAIGGPLGMALMAMGVSTALSTVSVALFGPKMPKTQLSRLQVSLDPSTPRKVVFGTTAMPLDLRYHEASGTDQEYMDYIIAVAAHKVKSIDAIWFEEKRAWTSSGGVESRYSGYLTVAVREEGTSANTIAINGGTKWGSTRRLTGCAYVHLRIKRTGNTKKAESPLVNGLPGRVTIIGEGGYLYDPRKDSTVTGGSGSHRANDQTTWGTYTDPDDVDNPALQLLFWLLGWKINDKLSVGCGVPPARIDMESFITAANICDESISLSGGGTQKRYRTSGTASDADDRMEIIDTFLSCMNGTLRDNAGKLTLTVMKNDLADYVLSFDDGDILDDFEWNQTRGLTETYNVARGRYVDPSDNSLYQMVDYPEVRITSLDGIERVVTIDLPYVEDGKRAQRIAKQVLQRNQYRGMFTATFTAKALGCQVGDVVRLTFGPLGWSNKLFRVVSQQIDFTGRVPLALVEENAAIYAWDAEESAPVTPTAPTVYDPLNNPFILAAEESGETANWSGIIDDDGNLPEDNADVTGSLDIVPPIIIQADYTGIISTGQLPRNFYVIRRKGGTDVSTTTTWSIEAQDGITGGTVTVSSAGTVTIPTGCSVANNAVIQVRSTRDSKVLDAYVSVQKHIAATPSTGTSGGTTVVDSTFASVSGTTHVAISDTMTVKTGTAGQIQFSAPLSITADWASPDIYEPDSNIAMKWQYRLASGGSWADAAGEVNSSPDVEVYYNSRFGNYLGSDGAIDCSPLLTGLTASTDYEVKLMARRTTATPTKTMYFSGTAAAIGG